MMGHVFVFGSNLAGRHGAGAALYAVKHYGAKYGVGEGRTGDAYALPTKDAQLRTLPKDEIKQAYIRFRKYASRSDDQFLLTPVGTGLAGYGLEEIRELLIPTGGPGLRNVWLTGDWWA
jgi:hypothetical protein